MGECKDYIIFCFGKYVGCETARSKKEACDLYVDKCKEKHIKDSGSKPSDDMIENIYESRIDPILR